MTLWTGALRSAPLGGPKEWTWKQGAPRRRFLSARSFPRFFVSVFRVTRGAFDPARFSARRKPQFTSYEKGSRAPVRAIESAFGYVETQGLNR